MNRYCNARISTQKVESNLFCEDFPVNSKTSDCTVVDVVVVVVVVAAVVVVPIRGSGRKSPTYTGVKSMLHTGVFQTKQKHATKRVGGGGSDWCDDDKESKQCPQGRTL